MNARVMDSRGGLPILYVVITAALGLGLLASGYLNYYQSQQARQTQQLLQGQITDLNYQVKLDQAKLSPSSSTSPSLSPSSSPAALPAAAVTATVVFSQLGANVTASAPVADLTYTYTTVNVLAVAELTATSLAANPACKPGALGLLVRRPLGDAPQTSQSHFIKKLGNYNFYYVPATTSCNAAVAADQAALMNTILPTLAN